MERIIQIAAGLALGLGLSAAAQTPLFTFSSTKIICDKQHTAFDSNDYTYCIEQPSLKGRYAQPPR